MAHQLLVGDEGAKFREVGMVIANVPSVQTNYTNWRNLAYQLDIPQFEIRKMQQSLLLGTQSHLDIILEILMHWRSQCASNATIERLCVAFREARMNAIADHLLNYFVKDSYAHKHEDISVTVGHQEKSEIAYYTQEGLHTTGKSVDLVVQQVGTTDIYYYPLKRLGHGATSLVFQGYFGNVELQAAVKEVTKEHNEVYTRELNVFMDIMGDKIHRHPNVIGLFHWTDYDDKFYFAMEKATCDLKNFLVLYPDLDVKILLKISYDMVKGLQFLHENNILHRDIKPENIFLFEKNKDLFWAKLGDFGVSRKMKSRESTMSNTAGTETWMSPEAIDAMHDGEPFPNSRALDIFSLGMVIYYALSNGKHPFAQSPQYKGFIAMNIKDPNVEPMRVIQIDGHETIKELLHGMMKKSPAKRPDINAVLNHPMWKI